MTAWDVPLVILFLLLMLVRLWHICYCIQRREYGMLLLTFIPVVGAGVSYWRMSRYAWSDTEITLRGSP